MVRMLVSGLRRFAAVLVLVAGGVPALLELRYHGQGSTRPFHHVEAASVRHHADNCLAAGIAGEKITPLVSVPALGLLADPVAVDDSRALRGPFPTSTRLPTSRSPPVA